MHRYLVEAVPDLLLNIGPARDSLLAQVRRLGLESGRELAEASVRAAQDRAAGGAC